MKKMNKRNLWILCGVLLLLAVAVPAYARSTSSWWNDYVKVTTTAELEPYKESYWASILKPAYLKCESVSMTIGNNVYIGSIYHYWWFYRKCGLTFNNIPADSTGIITVYYVANGSRNFQKSVHVGKTWLSTIRLAKLSLPWSPLDP